MWRNRRIRRPVVNEGWIVTRQGTLSGLGATGLLLATLACSACGNTPLPTPSPSPTAAISPSPTTAACTLPLTQDVYDGFHIAVPDGWDLSTVSGTIVVSKVQATAEQVVVHPALMTAGLTPAALFTALLDLLHKQIAVGGATMDDVVTSTGDQPPTATLSFTAGKVSAVGEAHLAILAQATAYGSTIGALVAGWAQPAQFATDRAMLAAIGACYGPQPGTLYQVIKDQVFTYSIPLGWSITFEGQDTITISEGSEVWALYLLTSTGPQTGVNSPQTLQAYIFRQLGIEITQTLSSGNGAGAGSRIITFTGTYSGAAVRGFVFVQSTTLNGSTSGVIRLGLAHTGLWNSVNGALIHVIGSIQHDFTQDLRQWENLQRQWQGFNQQVQGFDYALNGVDLVTDPTTGATFEAPYDTYDPAGKAGPGYYDAAGNKLQVVTP